MDAIARVVLIASIPSFSSGSQTSSLTPILLPLALRSMSATEFSIRGCFPGQYAKEWCPHIYDVMGAQW